MPQLTDEEKDILSRVIDGSEALQRSIRLYLNILEASKVTRKFHTHGIHNHDGGYAAHWAEPHHNVHMPIIPMQLGPMHFPFLGVGETNPEPPIVLPERKYGNVNGIKITDIHVDEAQYIEGSSSRKDFIRKNADAFGMSQMAGKLLERTKIILDATKNDMVKEGLMPDQSVPLTRKQRRALSRKKK